MQLTVTNVSSHPCTPPGLVSFQISRGSTPITGEALAIDYALGASWQAGQTMRFPGSWRLSNCDTGCSNGHASPGLYTATATANGIYTATPMSFTVTAPAESRS